MWWWRQRLELGSCKPRNAKICQQPQKLRESHETDAPLSSVQCSPSVVFDSLQPHELQHARPHVHHQLSEFSQTHVAMSTPLQYSCLENPMMEEPCRLQSMGPLRVGHDWATSISLFTFMHWRRKWQPTLVFLPDDPRDCGASWAAIYGVAQSQTRLKRLSSSSSMSIESVMPSSHLILCRPLLLLPPIPPSIRVFANESTLHMRWPKYWSFSFNIIPSKEIPGLISFRMDWLDLLAVQGTLKSLLQHHSSKASILRCSAFFTVQLSHPYTTTGAFQNTWPWQHLDFRLLASKATKTIHFYCFKPSSLWNFVTSTLENIQIEKELDKSGWQEYRTDRDYKFSVLLKLFIFKKESGLKITHMNESIRQKHLEAQTKGSYSYLWWQ